MLQRHIQHLYWRAGFGESLAVIKASEKYSAQQLFQKMLQDSSQFQSIEVVDSDEIAMKRDEFREMKKDESISDNRNIKKEFKKERKEEQGILNTTWIELMATEKSALREKIALFWHGHLVSRALNPVFSQSYLNTLRKNALGNFGDLLMAISKEPSMLHFLNNKQNKKSSPNENFARELMELFTLGRGNYTENDIKEVARAFTGWDFNKDGQFIFQEKHHDSGEKVIFGKKGNFNGEDVIKMILENKQTALFVTTKVYKYFVNENVDTQKVADLAKRFYKTNYDIRDLFENIFTSDWFYDDKNIGSHIKSPVELLVGIRRTLGLTFANPQPNLFVQKVLGQVLLYPPNVAGWAGGRNWIDSSSLLFRMQLPALIFSGKENDTSAKNDGDVNTEYQTKKRNFRAIINWENLNNNLSSKGGNYLEELSQFLLQVSVNKIIKDTIVAQTSSNSIKKMTTNLMMLPEYQVC
jgi:uncharacterized protein (DUF1800 family)